MLEAARNAPAKGLTEDLREVINTLRDKRYSWREIAVFLQDRGVQTDHSKIFRFMTNKETGKMHNYEKFFVPIAAEYEGALRALTVTPAQKKMLRFHFEAHNRTVTFTQLAEAGGYDTYSAANLQYGILGRNLGQELHMEFVTYEPDEKEFSSSSIGCGYPYAAGEFQLMMHHELARALEMLSAAGWFSAAAS